MKTILAILCATMLCVSCATTQPATKDNSSTLRWLDAGITSVSVLKTAANIAFGVACPMGTIPPDICEMERIAAAAADKALVKARAALAEYRADPSAINALLVASAKDALMSAWAAYNEVNGKRPFL